MDTRSAPLDLPRSACCRSSLLLSQIHGVALPRTNGSNPSLADRLGPPLQRKRESLEARAMFSRKHHWHRPALSDLFLAIAIGKGYLLKPHVMLSQFLGVQGSREHVVRHFPIIFVHINACVLYVQGKLILLSDVITDGTFLVHHFITQALKGEFCYVM